MTKLFFIINRIAGRGKNFRIKDSIKRYFLDKPDFEIEIHFTEYPGHAQQLAQQAMAQKSNVVIAAGGDGTLNEVAGILVGTNTIFGMIPIGSGNGFSRHLKIPFSLKKALDIIVSGHTARIDVGTINNQIFLSNTGFAIDSEVIALSHGAEKRGFIPYLLAGVKSVFNIKSPTCTVYFNEQKRIVRPFLFSVFNTSQYGYNVKIASGIKATDKQLNLLIVDSRNIFKVIWLLLIRPSNHSQYIYHATPKITVEFNPAIQYFQIDGELVNSRTVKVNIEIIPHGLQCLVPPNRSSSY